MIAKNHQISYRNVASKLYALLPKEIDSAIKSFHMILTSNGYHPTGSIFFSISDPKDEVMSVELFLPIDENYFSLPKEEEINFQSYFSVDNLLMVRVIDDFEVQFPVKYSELFEYLKNHQRIQKTPVFIQFKKTNSNQIYAEMSIGVV
ncbi:DUF5085 family protein [Psychrobacillus sp. NPDC058041]|uniref:DUF5085 family protein n=1 Tax=Psychrobacillus sp. NPDC058041 TaxID=3346310 RepID=UPI0036DF8EEC